jgi:hypothetical protein
MTDNARHGRPRLVVSPRRPNLDSLLHIRLDDLPPSSELRLRANTTDPVGREWRSWATFFAADGTVNLHRDGPVAGSYQGIDPMGLVWSMEPAEQPAGNHRRLGRLTSLPRHRFGLRRRWTACRL